jgi:hypothetical protein
MILSLLVTLVALAVTVRSGAANYQNKPDKKQAETSRLRIEVTGGDGKKPVGDASVYLKFDGDGKVVKGKHIELNLKTSQEGVASSPEIPQGQVLIQIVAQGWKAFGERYDVNQEEQTIRIHLERPTTKWY